VLGLAASIVIDERRGAERLHTALQRLEAGTTAPQP
jgi:hypothetical protein